MELSDGSTFLNPSDSECTFFKSDEGGRPAFDSDDIGCALHIFVALDADKNKELRVRRLNKRLQAVGRDFPFEGAQECCLEHPLRQPSLQLPSSLKMTIPPQPFR